MSTRLAQRRLTASLTLALLTVVLSFEVPFPPSATQIRSSVVSQNDVLATSSTALPVPVTQTVQLASGTSAEIISCHTKKQSTNNFLSSLFGADEKKNDKPVLAFIHGSFHASWCWAEYYMPFFAAMGYECVAFSLQGTGGTPGTKFSLLHLNSHNIGLWSCLTLDCICCSIALALPEGSKKVKISNHVADLNSFLCGLSNKTPNNLGLNLGDDPQIVLIGHSFGGLTIMKWLEEYFSSHTKVRNEISLAGVGLLCSVPPSGNGPMTLRYLLRSFRDSWKITVGFAMKKAIVDKVLCRELFFGGDEVASGISDEKLERYQSYFERDTVATIDLKDLAGKLPSLMVDKESGNAVFANALNGLALKPFVMGASDDFIVDKEGVIETAKYVGLNADEVNFVESPHDIMLGKKWQNGASAILGWIQTMQNS